MVGGSAATLALGLPVTFAASGQKAPAPTSSARSLTQPASSSSVHGPGLPKTAAAAPAATAASGERLITAYVTGYSWFDNTPVGSALVSHPVLHSSAGGTGTWEDPITVAVGHSLATGHDVLRWAPGTRFYLPDLRRYLIVEDTCGDGPTPQHEPCSVGFPAADTTWLDVWIDGRSDTPARTVACARAISGSRTVLVDPLRGHPVVAGPIAGSGSCSPRFGAAQ
jgi:hypothetical protein